MLKNNRVNMIIALIVAIVLWCYVLVEDKTASPSTIKDVPISYINEAFLTQNDMVMLEPEIKTVNISITGQRTNLAKIKAKDFKVVADLEGLKVGDNTVRLRVSGPEGVNISSVSEQKINVIVDNYVRESKPIKVEFSNQISDDREPYVVQISDQSAIVEGAKSMVAKVDHLNAIIDSSKVDNQMKTLTVVLVPHDRADKEVQNLTLPKDKISVTAIMLNVKTVALNIPVIGTYHGSFDRAVTLPKTITIKGTSDVINSIVTIDCDPLDVSQLYEDTTVTVKPILPEGVSISSISQNLNAYVVVRGAEVKNFSFAEDVIILEGVDESQMPEIEKCTIAVTVKGKTDVMSTLTEEDFSFTADISKLTEGRHLVKLDCKCLKEVVGLEYTPQEIYINIIENNLKTENEPEEAEN